MGTDGALTYRQLQAQQTKERIVAAARSVMSARGWAGATIEAIAREAGVAPQTVYATFTNKRNLLTGMRSVMMRDSLIPELMAQAQEQPTARDRLRIWAQLIRRQMASSYDVIAIHREAARSDAAVAAEYQAVLDNRYAAFEGFVIGFRDELPEGMTVTRATDLLWALSNEGLWSELTIHRGWSAEEFEEWLADALVSQLLSPRAS